MSCSFSGKRRYTVPTPTPARRAISSIVTARPPSAKASAAAARIRSRLRSASRRRRRSGRPVAAGLALMDSDGTRKRRPALQFLGGFASTEVLVPALIGVALLVAFAFHALRTTDPLIDLRLFQNRTFAAASPTLILFAIAVFGSFLLLPL